MRRLRRLPARDVPSRGEVQGTIPCASTIRDIEILHKFTSVLTRKKSIEELQRAEQRKNIFAKSVHGCARYPLCVRTLWDTVCNPWITFSLASDVIHRLQ